MIIDFPSGIKKIRSGHDGKKIVYATGTFDLTHAGHVLFLESCKKLGEVLVVQVASDKSVKNMKGIQRPIFNQFVRLKIIDSLKPVDYCFIDGVDDFKGSLKIQEEILKTLKPDFYVVNNDASDLKSRKKLTDKYNVEMVVLKRICNPEYGSISTTKIIQKIKDS